MTLNSADPIYETPSYGVVMNQFLVRPSSHGQTCLCMINGGTGQETQRYIDEPELVALIATLMRELALVYGKYGASKAC